MAKGQVTSNQMFRSWVAKRTAKDPCFWPEDGGPGPLPLHPCGKKSRESKRREPLFLRTYIIDGVGVRKLHFDWWIKVVSAFPKEIWLLKSRYGWWSVSRNPYLALESVHFAQVRGGRLLTKVIKGTFLWALRAPPFSPFQALG